MKEYYVVKKSVNGEDGFFFYENKPKRLKYQVWDKWDFEDMICSFSAYGDYNEQTEKKLLSRKYYICYNNGLRTMKKYEPKRQDNLQKEMGKLFLPPVGFRF